MADNGKTRRERLEAQLERAEAKLVKSVGAARTKVARRIAEIEGDLAMPPFPVALGYLWQAYLRLRRRTAMGYAGPQPIGWQDIDAFIRRAGLKLAGWEVALIEALDDLYLNPGETEPARPEGQSVVAAASASDAKGVRSILGAVGTRRTVKRNKKKGGDT